MKKDDFGFFTRKDNHIHTSDNKIIFFLLYFMLFQKISVYLQKIVYNMENNNEIAKKLLDELEKVEDKIFYSAKVKQITIDTIQDANEWLNYYIMGESDNNFESIVGSLSYKVDNIIDVCDKNLYDYQILNEVYQTLQKYVK